MTSKRKTAALIDSNSESESDLSDSDFKNVAKKPKAQDEKSKVSEFYSLKMTI